MSNADCKIYVVWYFHWFILSHESSSSSEIEGKQQTENQKVQNKMWKYCQNGEKDERIMFNKIDLREEIIFILQHS